MKTSRRFVLSLCPTACAVYLAFGLLGMFPGTAKAEEGYPSRSIEMIVASSPGSGGDIVGRLIAQQMAQDWKRDVVVLNKQGGSGIIGTQYVARSKPDGYTIYLTSDGPITINPAIYKTLPYDPVRDFEPVTLAAYVRFALVVNPSFPAKSFEDFLTVLRSKPGAYYYASIGSGSPHHLAMEMFKSMAKVNVNHVAYKGTGPGLTDLLGGYVHMMLVGIPPALGHIKAGKLRALAVATQRRLPYLPDVPTIAESGVPGYEVVSWFGVLMPAGTPAAIVTKLNTEIVDIIKRPSIQQALSAGGFDPESSTPAMFAERIKTTISTWKRTVTEAGIEQQ